MSKKKKHKKKFKAQLHQALQEMQQQPAVATPVEEHSSLRGEAEEPKNERTYELEENNEEKPSEKVTVQKSEVRPPKVDEEKKIETISGEYDYVRKDIKKIVAIVAICVVILVAIWILSLRTNYVFNLANHLANFSHLSQGK